MKKKLVIILISIIAVITLSVSIPFIILAVRTSNLNSDYSYLKDDETYSKKVEVDDIDLVTQHISCGYATIEMMSTYYGDKVSEDDLNSRNKGSITTSSSDGFLKEINKSIPNHKFIKRSYLKNDTLLKEIHASIFNHNPVALEWAALYEGEWTLHFSLITSIDISNDNVTIYNPYGYIENLTLNDFISRTTFKAYKNMPIFLNFGFAFGAFEKNTIFYAEVR